MKIINSIPAKLAYYTEMGREKKPFTECIELSMKLLPAIDPFVLAFVTTLSKY